MRNKAKPRELPARNFPALVLASYCDWSESLPWCLCYDTRLKTSLCNSCQQPFCFAVHRSCSRSYSLGLWQSRLQWVYWRGERFTDHSILSHWTFFCGAYKPVTKFCRVVLKFLACNLFQQSRFAASSLTFRWYFFQWSEPRPFLQPWPWSFPGGVRRIKRTEMRYRQFRL